MRKDPGASAVLGRTGGPWVRLTGMKGRQHLHEGNVADKDSLKSGYIHKGVWGDGVLKGRLDLFKKIANCRPFQIYATLERPV